MIYNYMINALLRLTLLFVWGYGKNGQLIVFPNSNP